MYCIGVCVCVFCVARGTTVVVVVEVVVSDRGGGANSIRLLSVGEGGTKSKRALDWFAPFTSYR